MRFEPANTEVRSSCYCWRSRTRRFRLYENQSTPAKIDQHFGGPRWTMPAAASSFLSRQKLIIGSTKPCAPSLSKGDDCKKSRSSLAIRNHRCARWSAGFGRTYRPMISAPFCPVRTENFVTLYFQKFRAISSNPYPSQMALSVNS